MREEIFVWSGGAGGKDRRTGVLGSIVRLKLQSAFGTRASKNVLLISSYIHNDKHAMFLHRQLHMATKTAGGPKTSFDKR